MTKALLSDAEGRAFSLCVPPVTSGRNKIVMAYTKWFMRRVRAQPSLSPEVDRCESSTRETVHDDSCISPDRSRAVRTACLATARSGEATIAGATAIRSRFGSAGGNAGNALAHERRRREQLCLSQHGSAVHHAHGRAFRRTVGLAQGRTPDGFHLRIRRKDLDRRTGARAHLYQRSPDHEGRADRHRNLSQWLERTHALHGLVDDQVADLDACWRSPCRWADQLA